MVCVSCGWFSHFNYNISIKDIASPPSLLSLSPQAHINFEDGMKVVGAVADGFPRTTLQVDFIKLLYDRLMELHNEYLDTPLEAQFPRPIFRIAVL